MFKGLVENLKSKKFWAAIAASAIAAACDQLGVSPDIIYGILAMFGVQIGAQGYADGATSGKEAVIAKTKADLETQTADVSPAQRAAILRDAAGVSEDDLK